MKISQIIVRLRDFQNLYGDVQVMKCDPSDSIYAPVKPIHANNRDGETFINLVFSDEN